MEFLDHIPPALQLLIKTESSVISKEEEHKSKNLSHSFSSDRDSSEEIISISV